jgi:hypothetical protein
VDCWNYSDVHDYIKWVKHGYGKVLDHACREIRLKHMTREQGVKLAEKYSIIQPKNLNLFLNWIGMTENGFNYILDQHRNPKIWNRNDAWEWVMTENIMKSISNAGDEGFALEQREQYIDFWITPKAKSTDREDGYILIGKGVL